MEEATRDQRRWMAVDDLPTHHLVDAFYSPFLRLRRNEGRH